MVRRLTVLGLFLLLAACGDGDQKQPTLFGEKVPGLGDMYGQTKDEIKEDKWWHEYYGYTVKEKEWTW